MVNAATPEKKSFLPEQFKRKPAKVWQEKKAGWPKTSRRLLERLTTDAEKGKARDVLETLATPQESEDLGRKKTETKRLREPEISPLEQILLPSIKEDLQERTIITNKPIPRNQLIKPFFGERRNCIKVEGDRYVNTDVYQAVLETFRERVGKEVEVSLAYKKTEEVSPLDRAEGKGSVVVITERVAPNLEVIYIVNGEFAGPAVTGSTKEIGHGVSYTNAEQIIIHDLNSNQATDIRSFLLPETQLRYVPVAADSESSRKYFAQGTGKYLQVENITNPKRLAGVLHEAGHERLQTRDPKPSAAAAEIMNSAPGGALQMLPKEDLQRLSQLLPPIEREASDEALVLIHALKKGGVDIGVPLADIKSFFNQGLSAHQESLRKILPGENINFKLYETGKK